MYKNQLLTFLSNFWLTFWEITGNFLGNLEQLVESPIWNQEPIRLLSHYPIHLSVFFYREQNHTQFQAKW